MKKYLITLGAIAATVFAFTSCNRETDIIDQPAKNKVVFTFTAEKAGDETKTQVVEGSKASYLWTAEDQANFKLYLIGEDGQGNETKTAVPNTDITFNFSQDYKTLTITAAVEEAESYTFRAIVAGSFSSGAHNPQIKSVQSPATDNFDPSADLLVSEDFTTTSPSNISLSFQRKAVINKMTLKNIANGEKVKSIVITSTQNLTGTFSGSSFSSGDKTIRLNYASQPTVSGDFPVYFAAIPMTGHTLTVTVTTDQHKYTKTFGGSIAFTQGEFTRFSVALPAGTNLDNVEGQYYIAAMPGNWFLMDKDCTSQSSGYYPGVATGVTSTASDVTGADFVGVTNFNYYFWDIVAVSGGYSIQNSETDLYLACTSGNSNYASYTDEVDDTAVFNIAFENGTAVITSTKYTERQLMYNSSGSSNRFAFYTGTQNPIYLIPTYDDGLTGVTLSFSQAIVNKTTSDYSSFTGLTVTADPNESSITNAITYGMTGDAIGTVNASTGAVTLNGSAGTATVTAVFAGNATYRQASASYTIHVTQDSGSKFKIVTSLSGVTEGTYIIVNDGYYLPNAAATNAGPVKNNNTRVTIEGDYVTNASDEMTWTFSGSTSAMTVKSTIEGNYYLVVSGNNNGSIRVNTTSGRTWTIEAYSGTSGAFTLKDNTNNRYCASYSGGSDWRSYNTYNAGNYGDGGRIYLYKEEDDNRVDPGMSWSANSASATMTDNGNTFTAPTLTLGNASSVTYSSSDTSVATIDASTGAITLVGGGTTTISAEFAGDSSYKPSTVSYTLTVTDNRTPVGNYDFVTVAELNGLVTSSSATYSGYLTNAVVSFVPATNTAIVKDATGSVMIYKSGHGLLQGQTYTGAIEVTAIKYNGLYSEITLWDASFTGAGAVVNPETVALSSLIGHYDDYQNAYVQVAGLTVTSISGKNINVTDGTNNYVVFDNPGTLTCEVGDVITAKGTITKYQTTEELKVWDANHVMITSYVPRKITFSQPTETGCSFTVKVNGSNITSGTAVSSNTTVTLTATVGSNYNFDGWNVIGASVADASSTTTTFSMGTSAVSVSASFTEKGSTPQPMTLTFSLTSNPGGWPTANSTTLTDYTYNLNNVAYTFKLKNVKQNSGYLMLTSTAALGLPAISGYKLVTVKASNSSGCSTSTRVGISSSDSSASYISGGAYKTWSTTGSTYTYNLTSTAANTVYYLYVTNKNAQITSLELTYNPVN